MSTGLRNYLYRALVQALNSSDAEALYKLSVNKNEIDFLLTRLDREDSLFLFDDEEAETEEADKEETMKGMSRSYSDHFISLMQDLE